MTFRPGHQPGPHWAALRRPLPRGTRWIMPYVKGRPLRRIAEWGAGYGEHLDLRPLEGEYRGFETSPPLLARAQAQGLPITGGDPALPLPLPEASQDLFLAVDFLEYLRMDELYMVLAEARRTLRPGGLCLLRSLSFAPGRLGRGVGKAWTKLHAARPAWVKGRRPLELTHYISPEDWRTLTEAREPGAWISSQLLVLERL